MSGWEWLWSWIKPVTEKRHNPKISLQPLPAESIQTILTQLKEPAQNSAENQITIIIEKNQTTRAIPTSDFESLPEELKFEIVNRLDNKSMAQFAQTCRTHRRITEVAPSSLSVSVIDGEGQMKTYTITGEYSQIREIKLERESKEKKIKQLEPGKKTECFGTVSSTVIISSICVICAGGITSLVLWAVLENTALVVLPVGTGFGVFILGVAGLNLFDWVVKTNKAEAAKIQIELNEMPVTHSAKGPG